MRYFIESIATAAYWKFALFSKRGFQSIFAWLGGIFFVVQVLDFFKVLTRDDYGPVSVLIMIAVAVFLSLATRPPTQLISVKLPQKDCSIDVRIGDVLDQNGAVVISTNTTFDTDTGSSIISPQSLQGQFEAKFFLGNSHALDALIEQGLVGKEFAERKTKERGKTRSFPMGTIVPVSTHGRTFYFCAMAHLSDKCTASTTAADIEVALRSIWSFVRLQGELQELSLPVIGTGRGRSGLPRERMIELIASSFKQATTEGLLTHKLVIVVHPADAKNFGINLWEVRDDISRIVRH